MKALLPAGSLFLSLVVPIATPVFADEPAKTPPPLEREVYVTDLDKLQTALGALREERLQKEQRIAELSASLQKLLARYDELWKRYEAVLKEKGGAAQ